MNVDPVHDWVPHVTLVAASWQPPAPLHRPVLPQGGLAVQRFIVSGWPSGTKAQVPALAPTLHAMHSEQELVPQQTPSTQKLPVRQSLVAVQVWPWRRRLPQRLVCGSQMLGARQSRSFRQTAKHAFVPLHMYGAHATVVAGWQTPRPLHVRPLVWVDRPAAQDADAHGVPAAYSRQAPAPLQKPSVLQLGPPWSEQRDMMSAAPLGRFEQVPRDAVSAHDLQTPWQVVSQQTPCSQFPDRHSFLFAQTAPFGERPQLPFTHDAGGWHWVLEVHEAKQAVASHR